MALKRISQPVTPLDGTEHLDTLTRNGVYHQNVTLRATAELGYPVLRAGLLEVHAPVAAFTYQRYTVLWSGDVYYRGAYRGEWKPWRKILTE